MKFFIQKILIISLLQLFCINFLYGQYSKIEGKITNSEGKTVELVNVFVKSNPQQGTQTNTKGEFSISCPSGKDFVLVISHISFLKQEIKLNMASGESHYVEIKLKENPRTTEEVEIEAEQDFYEDKREQVSTIKLNPKLLESVPTGFAEFSQKLVSIGLGISSNTELSGSYRVRGGNFDENLVYVNGIQIYRPFLISAGRQEGLSFVNSNLVKEVEFSSGGWQPKYGDKLSSVLNIDYKTPTKFGGSASLGLVGANMHLEGASKNKKFNYLLGIRHKDGRYLFKTFEVDGSYLPVFTDIQSSLNFDLNDKEDKKATLGVLLSYARNRYQVIPQTRETNFGTFNEQLRFFVSYNGQELLSYDTYQIGLNLTKKFSEKFSTRWTSSAMKTREREYANVEGAFRLCDVNTNLSSNDFNECTTFRSVGKQYDYSRNSLNASILSFQNRSTYRISQNTELQFGARIANQQIDDNLYEYSFVDSADFVQVADFLESDIELNSQRVTGYVQSTHFLDEGKQQLTYGVRLNYWSLNKQVFVSPRLQYSIQPDWEKDFRFNFAVGMYQQSPFYREMRDFEGKINKDLKAQSSVHAVAGFDYNFKKGKRPFKLIGEVYYKQLWNVVPYDVDNVRLRYYATNDAKAKVFGADMRISGEFVKGLESWFSVGYLSAKEDVGFDEKGFIRRPSDQRLTATIFFQDHIPNDPTVKVFLRLLYGSGLPFSPPNLVDYRAALSGTKYRRVDIGFSKLVSFNEAKKINTLWLGLEVLNLLGTENVISYSWIQDFVNNVQYAIPNALSQRFLNVKVVVGF
jgi:hypothetical protein